MPLSGPPPLLSPTLPIVVRRGYRSAPAFVAGARRSVRLATSAGQRIVVPCTGGVRFAGRVAGGPPVVTVGCGALGLRVTVGGITHRVGRGASVRAGEVLGRATGPELGLSVRRDGIGYVDPVPLLSTALPGHPAPVIPRSRPSRWRPAPAVHGLRTLPTSTTSSARDAASGADRWLGFGGILVGLAAAGWRAGHHFRARRLTTRGAVPLRLREGR